jgi:hypothetical protein
MALNLHRRWIPAILAATVFALVPAGCGSSSARSAPSTSSPAVTSAPSTVPPPATEPPATDDAAVRPVIGHLLHEWDHSMTAILARPQAVLDHPADRLRTPLKAVFTVDSPYIRDFDRLLSGYVSHHLANKPDHRGLGQQTLYLRTTETPSPNSISFVWCSYDDSTTVNVLTGAVVSRDVAVTQGAGSARRTDGHWALYRLFQLGSVSRPAGSANPCPGYINPPRASS